jgi:flagellum-specific peptidoglycan hydrolase FlgJ
MAYSQAVYNASKKFVDQYGLGVGLAIKGTGLFFPAVMAQSAFESGYGSRIPAGSNNFGGIKYNPNLDGVIGYVISDTSEYVNGVKRPVKKKFSKFKDVASGFRAHISVLLLDRYKAARLNATTPQEQILMIAKAGYTTTPPAEYLRLMKGIIEAITDYKQIGRIA